MIAQRWIASLLTLLAISSFAASALADDPCKDLTPDARKDLCAAPSTGLLELGDTAAADEERLATCCRCAKEAHDAALKLLEKPPANAPLAPLLEAEAETAAAAEEATIRHESAKLLRAYAALSGEIKAARAELTTSKEKREAAKEKATEDEVKDAKEKVDEAESATAKARKMLDKIDSDLLKLKTQLAKEQGTHEARQAWLSEVQVQLARAVDDDEKARLNGYRRKIEAQQAASVELQSVLQKLTNATAEQQEELAQAVEESEQRNKALSDKALKQIALKNGDRISYGVTLAAVRLRATRDPNQDARLRDYQPEADFVPTLVGLRIVYEPSGGPWRLDTAGEPMQLIGIEFPLYLEKGTGNSLESLSAGVGLTLVDGLLGVGLAFDVYRVVKVKGGQTETGIMPWTLSRTGEVTAENVAVMVTIGLDPIVNALSGSTDADGEEAP